MIDRLKNFIKNLDLKRQLGVIVVFSLILSLISLILILPNLLTPFYEKNIYELLSQPLSFIESENNKTSSNVAYIINNNNNIYISSNFTNYFNKKDVNLINYMATKPRGKFNLNNQTYYYSTSNENNIKVITLTDDEYIISQQKMLGLIVFPVVAITIFIITLILVVWNNHLVNKISKIKEKVDNIDNNEYEHDYTFKVNDEVNSLIKSVEYMRKEINSKEEYKTNMYQSLSHELKTPIAVISSYVEAVSDKVVSYEEAIDTIDEEIKILSKDVNKILELNKLNYLKESNEIKDEKIDVTDLLNDLVKKYKLQRRDVEWRINIEKENILRGTYDIWKLVFDNIFGNFVVYADKCIKVTIKNNTLEFYNDGDNIEDDLINDVFTQYRKGIKGKFGLGLSIVKKSVELCGYKITVENKDKGVLFKIQ